MVKVITLKLGTVKNAALVEQRIRELIDEEFSIRNTQVMDISVADAGPDDIAVLENIAQDLNITLLRLLTK